jgi:hypothetical protein
MYFSSQKKFLWKKSNHKKITNDTSHVKDAKNTTIIN